MVLKVDRLPQARELGVVGKDPRGAIAYKFPAEEATTSLLGVTIGVGRTGKVTPTAQLDPVFIGGVTVSNASLHNYDQVATLDIRHGRPRSSSSDQAMSFPTSSDLCPARAMAARQRSSRRRPAPSAAPKLIQPAGAIDWFCPNPKCPERVTRTLEFFVSRGAMDIEGMGPQTIVALIENDLIEDEADIFFLEAEPLARARWLRRKESGKLCSPRSQGAKIAPI